MYYDVDCAGCKKELIIEGAYMGSFDGDDCWCEDCGYQGEFIEEPDVEDIHPDTGRDVPQ